MLWAMLILGVLPLAVLPGMMAGANGPADDSHLDEEEDDGDEEDIIAVDHMFDAAPGIAHDIALMPGETVLKDFMPGKDSVDLRLADDGAGWFSIETTDDGRQTSLHYDGALGEARLTFAGLGELPVDDITLHMTDPASGAPLSFGLAALIDGDPLQPIVDDDPVGPGGDPGPDVLSPTPGDADDDALPPSPPDGDILPPVTDVIWPDAPAPSDGITHAGGAGDDRIDGTTGPDILSGGAGDDIIRHTTHPGLHIVSEHHEFGWHIDNQPDQLFGGPGRDVLVMDRADMATGGDDADTFWLYFDTNSGSGFATIADFAPGQDFLRVTLNPHAGYDDPVVSVAPSDDGRDGVVTIDGEVVALLQNAPDATVADVYVEITDDIYPAGGAAFARQGTG